MVSGKSSTLIQTYPCRLALSFLLRFDACLNKVMFGTVQSANFGINAELSEIVAADVVTHYFSELRLRITLGTVKAN